MPGIRHSRPSLRLHRWNDREIIGLALAALAGGFGQFGVIAALGDVAKAFGQSSHGTSLAEQAGLSGTVLGVGLAVIRLASLGGLPVASLADRVGRRRLLLSALAGGLALTALAAISPRYWWFVAVVALGRPLLSGADAVTQVSAAEHTGTDDRARAIGLVAAGYGLGAGLTAVIHSVGLGAVGFRGLFALALLPLTGVALLRRWISEPDRFLTRTQRRPVLAIPAAVESSYRKRLVVVTVIAFAISVITGPANGFVFLYADNVIHQAGYLTATMVVAAGGAGLIGLVIGQRLADRVGRRPTAAAGMAGVAVCGVAMYSGSQQALLAGYIFGVLTGAMIAPAVGALVNELFPTSIRATVSGWWIASGVAGAAVGLVAFGAIADLGNRFSAAAALTFLPAAGALALFSVLPETRGCELEDVID